MGCSRSAPIAAGSPTCRGAPWLNGTRAVTCTALIACSGLSQRMVTTIGPENGPAGSVGSVELPQEAFLAVLKLEE